MKSCKAILINEPMRLMRSRPSCRSHGTLKGPHTPWDLFYPQAFLGYQSSNDHILELLRLAVWPKSGWSSSSPVRCSRMLFFLGHGLQLVAVDLICCLSHGSQGVVQVMIARVFEHVLPRWAVHGFSGQSCYLERMRRTPLLQLSLSHGTRLSPHQRRHEDHPIAI